MAIGKVNAYATVEGPKVDFGDIALNAQKIQQADLDRMKSMIPEEKKSDFKIKDLDTGIKKTGNGGYDQTLTSFLADTLSENLEIDKEAERVGRYTPELIAKKQKLQNEVTGLKGLAEKFTTDTIDFSKKLEEGKLSSVDESRFDIIEDIAAKRNLEILKDDSGNTVFKVRMVGDDGSFLSDSEGKPLYKTFNDRGVARDSITKYELENGALFGNSIKELDRAKTIGAIQNNLKLRTEVRDPKGTLITTKTFLSDEDEASLNNQINGVLSNYDNLASYLYSLDREKYATPKTMEQYKKDGDIDFAVKAMSDSVKAGLGFQTKEDRVRPNVTNINLGDDNKKLGLQTVNIPNTIQKYVSKDASRFIVIQQAKPTTSSFSVYNLKGDKGYELRPGSILTGFTKGSDGSAIVRVFQPTSKSASMIKNKEADLARQIAKGNLTDEQAEFELSSYSLGVDGNVQYYRAPNITVDGMLPKGASYKDALKDITGKVR